MRLSALFREDKGKGKMMVVTASLRLCARRRRGYDDLEVLVFQRNDNDPADPGGKNTGRMNVSHDIGVAEAD